MMKVSRMALTIPSQVITILKEELPNPDEQREEAVITTPEMMDMVTNQIAKVIQMDPNMTDLEMNGKEEGTTIEIGGTNDTEMTEKEWIVVKEIVTGEMLVQNMKKNVVKEEWIEIGEEGEVTINTQDQILWIPANLAHHTITIMLEEVEKIGGVEISNVKEEDRTMEVEGTHHLVVMKKITNEFAVYICYL